MAKKKKIIPKFSRSKSKLGKAPGHISYVGSRDKVPSHLQLITYNENDFQQREVPYIKLPIKNELETSMLNVVGISDEDAINSIGIHYNLNNLLLEDVMDTLQRPKVDEYEEHLFGVFKMLYLDTTKQIKIEHVSLILLDKQVLIFQETDDDVFNGVRERIINKYGRIRSRGADYLFFALLDAIVDNYYVALDDVREELESLEEEVYENPTKDTARKIQTLKKEILRIRKWVFPVKEIVNRLLTTEHQLIQEDTKLFLRDTFDHCTEINEDIVLYREMVTSLMEMYMTNMSNKMNEVMKVLTVIASIFIPLTFIAGIYGMNFTNMPELNSPYGYPLVWASFFIIGLGLLIYFKKKGWL
ncbi:magnesium and cobalt transport protein CorA [Croceivirga radicis]|uniref:Magnesium transport protein CorA n=1 Tax=Croceivirga radicis TaxID=1929488 RepID=A0A1V6LRQ8_9FLAO|nr:magnesium/cobalt transporter CorA [Croceivirga radicis]OQD42881.1 magnesium and cobalt transport protein CorA [Croceivirga radicis]